MKTIEDIVRGRGGIWPFNPQYQTIYWDRNLGCSVAYSSPDTVKSCTCTEFEECAKKLRNEPDWKDAPDWAVAYAQDSDEEWYWYEVVPSPNTALFNGFPGKSVYASTGEVIGDWRKTLRLRPEEKKKMKTIMKTISETEVAYRKALEKVLEDSKCGVVPKSHIEAIEDLLGANQKENKNDWHKRGDLPPVGTVCEVLYDGAWEQTKIIGWDDARIVFNTPWDDIVCYDGVVANTDIFRLLQNERERLIEEAGKVAQMSQSIEQTIACLLDADMLKMPEGK